MSSLLDRYLPTSERRTTLWLALGGTLIATLAGRFGNEITRRLPAGTGDTAMPSVVAAVIPAIAEFALVTLLVALLIRLAHTPRALALYLLLGGVLGAVMGAADPAASLAFLGVGLGAVAGAWIASTVSLDRIRDEGFSGDHPEGSGLRRHPQSRGWSFLGWEGRPPTADALVAIALVAVAVIPSVVMTAAVYVLSSAAVARWTDEAGIASLALWAVVLPMAWFFSAELVTRKTGVASSWMVALSGLAVVSTLAVVDAGQRGDAGLLLPSVVLGAIPALLSTAAALGGTALALKRKPATLGTDEPHSSGML